MAITIRNKQTEELIRKIGRRTGEGPSAVVRRLAKTEGRQPDRQRAHAVHDRGALSEPKHVNRAGGR